MSLYSKDVVREDMERMAASQMVPFEMLRDKTILITGATGMLALYMTYACMYMNERDNLNIRVLALVRNEKKAQDRFAEFLGKPNFAIYAQDVCEPLRVIDHVDYIVHAAGAASPFFIKNDPVGIVSANTVGTMNVLEFARQTGAIKTIFLSTREIYGEVKGVEWIREEDMGLLDPAESRSCYPESKRMAEQIFKSYYNQYGVPYVVARIAHSYGPGMIIENDGRVMADFICDTVHGRDIIMKSEGLAERAFCYITDAVSALFLILLKGEVTQAYNVANETEAKAIREVAQMLVDLFPGDGRKLIFDIQTDTSGYCAYKRVGLATAKLEKLGWRPQVDLEQGLVSTVKSFME